MSTGIQETCLRDFPGPNFSQTMYSYMSFTQVKIGYCCELLSKFILFIQNLHDNADTFVSYARIYFSLENMVLQILSHSAGVILSLVDLSHEYWDSGDLSMRFFMVLIFHKLYIPIYLSTGENRKLL